MVRTVGTLGPIRARVGHMDRRTLFRIAAGGCLLTLGGGWSAGAFAAQDRTVPARKPEPPRPLRRVVLDPGHGGHDPGAIGVRGTHEKDITLDIAKELARQLRKARGLEAVLTRETDVFLSLGKRVEIARTARAELFISIHADSAPNPNARGLSAYTLSEKATDAFAEALAQQENLADRLGVAEEQFDANVQAFLVDLAADYTRRASLSAKQGIVKGVGRDIRLLDNPMRSANFAVLKAPDVPSVLVETGFLSNPEDERLLRDATARRRIAAVLARELVAVVNAAPFA